jgi:hypothetical protein
VSRLRFLISWLLCEVSACIAFSLVKPQGVGHTRLRFSDFPRPLILICYQLLHQNSSAQILTEKGCRPVFSSVELSLGPASKNMPRGAKSPARFCLPPSVFVPAFDLFHAAGSRSLLSLCAQVVLPGQ